MRFSRKLFYKFLLMVVFSCSVFAMDDLGKKREKLEDACWYGRVEVVKQLIIEEKIDPNYVNKNNLTPLSTAAQQIKLEIVKILLEHKANLNLGNPTPLFRALKGGTSTNEKEKTKIIMLFLEQKADVTRDPIRKRKKSYAKD